MLKRLLDGLIEWLDRPSPLQIELLAIIRENPAALYGIPLRKEAERRLGHRVSIGALYAELERLEDSALIRSFERDGWSQRGYRKVRYYEPAEAVPHV